MRASTYVRLALGGALLSVSLAAMADNAVTTDSAGVYAGPDSSYPEVAQLDPDTPVQVMGCLDDWSWCDVAFEGNRGWLYSPDISFQYQGGYVPFYSYAPSFGISVVSFSVDSYWGHYYQGRPWFAQRTEWEHRTIEHRRPSGPPPRSGPPPHDVVRAERPHAGGVRLSSAQGHGDARPADHAPPHDEHAPPQPERGATADHRSSPDRGAPPEHGSPQPEHMTSAPDHSDRGGHQPDHAAPPEHAAPPQHAGPQPVAPQRDEKAGRPAEREDAAHRAPPPKDDKDERPH